MRTLDFAPNTFATQNFHCGFYEDGDKLENLLNFRKDTLEDHFERSAASVHQITKIMASWFKKPIKKILQKQSEPLKAFKQQDKKLMERFFGFTKIA